MPSGSTTSTESLSVLLDGLPSAVPDATLASSTRGYATAGAANVSASVAGVPAVALRAPMVHTPVVGL